MPLAEANRSELMKGNPDDLLTTTEAARIAGVGTTSVKRWADLNLLRCVRTAGGHRRFRREDLERFMAKDGAAHLSSSSEWIERMAMAGCLELQGEMLAMRDRLGAWYLVAEELGEVIAELGRRWQAGKITIAEEHVMSEKLQRAIARCVESIPEGRSSPRCLLASAEGDDHTLGLSLVELCLREARWSSVWTGRKTPTDELVAVIEKGQVDMLALSASLSSIDAEMLARQAERLGKVCRARETLLVFGGAGAWPARLDYGERFHDFGSFQRWAIRPSLKP